MYHNDRNQYRALNLKIIEPQRPRIGNPFHTWVTKKSPRWQKLACIQLRRYQAIECGDGINMCTGDSSWRNLEVFIFKSYLYDPSTKKDLEYAIGAAGFEKANQKTTLQFCWLHPLYRNQGLLKSEWPAFIERFGSFDISEPRSNAMKGFLDSRNDIES